MRISEAFRTRQKRIVWIDKEIERQTIEAGKLADVEGMIPPSNCKEIDEIFWNVHVLRQERHALMITEDPPIDVLETLGTWDDVELAYLVNELSAQEMHEVIVMGGRLIDLCRDRLEKFSDKIRKEVEDGEES